VPENKVRDYLLSETHAIGKSKAKFFRQHGFDESNVHSFKMALIAIAQTEQVSQMTNNPFGVKYSIEGTMETPNGVIIKVRTIWIIENGSETPKLVTVYPMD
jgi:hypothetical protein